MKALNLGVVCAVAFVFVMFASIPAIAGNGNHMIGLSPASIALGGTGVANYTENMDALFKNPAMLSEMTCTAGRTEVALGGSFLELNASANTGPGWASSTAGGRFLPNVAGGYRLDDNLTLSLGAFAYGGNATNYQGNASLFQLQSENRLYRLAAGAAYQINKEVSIGVSPFMTYAQLNINEDALQTGTQSNRSLSNTLAFGVGAGIAVKPVPELVIGGSFVTRQNLAYSSVLNLNLFGPNPALGVINPTLNDIHIQTPFELAFGASYVFFQNFKLIFDYRFIDWSDSDVFRELNWQNQNVIAVGAEYATEDLALRLGFNYASSPIANDTNEAGSETVQISGVPVEQRRISMLDIVAFPGISQAHFTAGAGYQVVKGTKVDLAFEWAPSVTITRSGQGGQTASGEAANYSYSGSLNIWSISAGVKTVF